MQYADFKEFRFNRNSEYVQPKPKQDFPGYLRRKKAATDRTELTGQTCPSCGLKRSKNNKCFCNED